VNRIDYLQKLVKISLHSVALRMPLADAHWAVDNLLREAGTPAERIGASLSDQAVRFATGRSDTAKFSWTDAFGPQGAATLIQQALIDPGYRSMGAKAIAQEAAGQYRLTTATGTVRWPPVQDCFAALYRMEGGDTTGVAGALRRLRAFAAIDHPPVASDEWKTIDFRVCPLLLEVLMEGPPRLREPRPSLDRLDSLMQNAPRGFQGAFNFAPTAYANFTIARLREAQGDIPRALAAIRRREVDYFPAYLWSLPAFLRQEGRLATLAGDTAGARRAYDDYLTLRSAPDAPMQPQRDSVIAERAALSGRLSP
jgi:hypothetical protein